MGDVSFTDRELDVMSVLWREASGTVAEVRERLADDLAYTTVLTVLQTLEDKGHVRHEEEGRAYRYFPLVAQEEAGDSALGRIVEKIFHGSEELLLARLVADRELSEAQIRRMRGLLSERLSDPGAPGGLPGSGRAGEPEDSVGGSPPGADSSGGETDAGEDGR